jgi:hypothetical protein
LGLDGHLGGRVVARARHDGDREWNGDIHETHGVLLYAV